MVRLEYAQAADSAEPRSEGEPYVNEDLVGIEARLLANGDHLRSNYTAQRFEAGIAENYTHTLAHAKKVGYEERLDYYSRYHRNASFGERMNIWKRGFSGYINKKRDELAGDERQEWIDFCGRFGMVISDTEGATEDHAQTFFDRYFKKETTRLGEDWVAQEEDFVMHGLNLYKEGDRVLHRKPEVDLDKKREWLEELGRYSLGNIAGKVTSLLIDGRASIEDEGTQPIFVEAANRKINSLSQSNKILLDDFERLLSKADGASPAQQPPAVQPDRHEPPTPVTQNEVRLSLPRPLQEYGNWRQENQKVAMESLVRYLRDTYGIQEDLFPADLSTLRVVSAKNGAYIDLQKFIQEYGQDALSVPGELPPLWVTAQVNFQQTIVKPNEQEIKRMIKVIKDNHLIPMIHLRYDLASQLRPDNQNLPSVLKEFAVGLARYMPGTNETEVKNKTFVLS